MPREIGLGNNLHVQEYDGDIDFDFFEDDDHHQTQKRTKDSIPSVTPLLENQTTKDETNKQVEIKSENSNKWMYSESENTFESDTESENSLDITVTESSTSSSSSWNQDDSFASLSDDEITDVTPLSSTNASPLPASPIRLQLTKSIIARKKIAVKFNEENSAKKSPMNLDVIVQAILKLEQDRENGNGSEDIGLANKEKVGSMRSGNKKNMSFTDEQVRKIDRENHLLLKKILTQQQATKTGAIKSRLPRPPSSAINRIRQQRKIEAENLSLLKRIQSAKPTKELSRQYLLKSHEQLHTCSDSSSIFVGKSSNSSSEMSSRSVSMVPIQITASKIPQSRARVRSNRATQVRSEWNAKIHAKS